MLLKIPRRKLSITHIVPKQTKVDYFKSLKTEDNLYVCVEVSENGISKLFFETPATAQTTGIVRVFLSIDDIQLYMNKVSEEKQNQNKVLKFWETSFSELFNVLLKINNQKTKKMIKAISCIVINNYLVDLDVFWTNEKDTMV